MKRIAVGDLGEFWYGDYKEPFEQLEGGVPGHPVGVVLKDDDGKLLCAFCGKVTEQLGNHAAHKHGMKADEYKREVGLLQQTALVSERLRQRMVAHGLRMAKSPEAVRRWTARGRQQPTYGARNKRRPEALNKTGRCLAQLVAVARTVAAENGGRITGRMMRRHGVPEHAMVPYGGWRRIAQLAGATARPNSKRFSDAQLLTMLRTLALELGRTPSESDLHRYGLPTRATYDNHFGIYSAACRLAGLVPNLPTPVSRDEEVAILVAYATIGSCQRVAPKVGRTGATVRAVLTRYGIGLQNWGHTTAGHTPEHRATMFRAAEIARRLADWPEPEVAA